jgi:hypothetical protein
MLQGNQPSSEAKNNLVAYRVSNLEDDKIEKRPAFALRAAIEGNPPPPRIVLPWASMGR